MAESITPMEDDDGGTSVSMEPTALTNASASRKVKRKVAKKEKRKQIRKELAEKARAEEEARLNDPEEQRRIKLDEERENERLERERREFEEREKLFLEELARKQAKEEEAEESRKALEEELKRNHGCEDNELNEDDEWEYVEEGPPEIIWQGNEIIVKKNRVKVKKKDANQLIEIEDPNRPTSNPLPPQSEAYTAHKDASKLSAQQLLENVAQEVSNFGTEQDKAHCPFHIKTGACRFGLRCNRAHFYPDKSCTLLIKNMYIGPGLAWEQDEGLESYSQAPQWRFTILAFLMPEIKRPLQIHTDEEVEHCYEEFYEDVHTEFLKFGEIVNFKVCRNGSFHLRGNVYIHYKSLDSAVLAYHAVNGRYFAGKQVTCEFVSVTKWKVAICGEYMKSRLKTCSRGTACNFLHCFGNPGGDYEWADWDRPPPRYWVKKMTALFGCSDESWYDRDQQMEQESPREWRNSCRISLTERDRYHSRRSRSREGGDTNERYARSSYDKHDEKYQKKHTHDDRKKLKSLDEKYHEDRNYESHDHDKNLSSESDSDRSKPERVTERDESRNGKRRRSTRHEHEKTQSRDYVARRSKTHAIGSDKDSSDMEIGRHHKGSRKRSTHMKEVPEHSKIEEERTRKRTHSSRRRHLSLEASKVSSSGHLEMGHRESDNDEVLSDKHKRSKRKLTFDGIIEHHPNEKNEEEDRWIPDDENSPKKDHHKSRGLLDDDGELYGQKSGSRSRRTRWSSWERRSDSLEGVNPAEEVIKSEDNYKKRSREKHRSHGRSGKEEEKKSKYEKKAESLKSKSEKNIGVMVDE